MSDWRECYANEKNDWDKEVLSNHSVKYAICIINFSIGKATEYGYISWISESGCSSTEIEDATFYDLRSQAEQCLKAIGTRYEHQVRNIVEINFYEVD